MGGEKLDLLAVVFSALGSPPRGRGKDVDWLGFNQFFRITPAWAGKRYTGHAKRLPPWDHPRVGGEKLERLPEGRTARGSPPRGRGKVIAAGAGADGQGITPAWAGKSHIVVTLGKQSKDHPRVGGEKLQAGNGCGKRLGSPPRGRGKVLRDVVLPVGRRITPAWAGKSYAGSEPETVPGDHPRVGGEKY